MAVDMFLKLDGIEGESKAKGFEKSIQVLAWSWGMSQSGTFHEGGGGGGGKVNIQDISLTKYLDASSPFLQMKCQTGAHIAKGSLHVRKAGGDQLEYIKIELESIIVSSVSTGGSGGEDRLTENVSINFAKVKFHYQPQDDKGAAQGGLKTAGWDIPAVAKYG